ncbi:MAG: GNAT family N-acetyltransferase [Anaerolineae bacterium]|jgi:RimJ/RimL family protein N-acetyltransferase
MADLRQLTIERSGVVSSLFRCLDFHLAIEAVLSGVVPGQIYADDVSSPRSALVRVENRFYLSGSPREENFNRGLRRLFDEEIYPQASVSGETMFVLYYPSADWEACITDLLSDKHPMKDMRQFYACSGPEIDWRAVIEPEFALRSVDRELLENEELTYVDQLRTEVLSESPSIEHYLSRRFGFCLLQGDVIAGWCLSEYNTADRCEVGIETVDAYRRRGVATVTATALVEHAAAQGVSQVGWHCWTSNAASAATALKVGFRKVRDYPALFAWFDPVANLAVNGHMAFQNRQYSAAVEWYERAFQVGQPPSWAYWSAACANAMAGRLERALDYLRQALDQGIGDLESVMSSRYLRSLHDTPGWQALVRELKGGAA